jgi:hypothetical protein
MHIGHYHLTLKALLWGLHNPLIPAVLLMLLFLGPAPPFPFAFVLVLFLLIFCTSILGMEFSFASYSHFAAGASLLVLSSYLRLLVAFYCIRQSVLFCLQCDLRHRYVELLAGPPIDMRFFIADFNFFFSIVVFSIVIPVAAYLLLARSRRLIAKIKASLDVPYIDTVERACQVMGKEIVLFALLALLLFAACALIGAVRGFSAHDVCVIALGYAQQLWALCCYMLIPSTMPFLKLFKAMVRELGKPDGARDEEAMIARGRLALRRWEW